MFTNPFKYGRLFDPTFTRLVLALVLLLPWTLSFCHRSAPELHRERRALTSVGTLLTDSLGTPGVSLSRGDSVTLLGVLAKEDSKRPLYWVESDGGVRGYLPQECLGDSAYVVNSSLHFSKDSTSYRANHVGDTIVVKAIALDKNNLAKSTVRLASGKDTLLSGHPFVFFLADSLADDFTVRRYDENMEPMSEGAFKSRCLGKKLSEVETALSPALEIGRGKDGLLQARYPVLVFREGKFYTPIVDFDADSVATGFRYLPRASRSMNSWVLKYIPFYGHLCDLPMVGAIWSNGAYQTWSVPISKNFVNHMNLNGLSMGTIGYFALFLLMVIAVILRALLTPLLLPWLCYGVLRFPLVFKSVGNHKMYYIVMGLTWFVTAGWVLATLSNYYIILTIIGMVIVVSHFKRAVSGTLLSNCPSDRCRSCKTLYSTTFTERVEEGDRENAIEEVEETLDTVITSVERWQTYDEVTTTYGDGSKKTSKQNIQNHEAKHGYHIIGVFMESVVYIPYTNYYTCAECGTQEMSYERDRKVLKRQKLREYQSHF